MRYQHTNTSHQATSHSGLRSVAEIAEGMGGRRIPVTGERDGADVVGGGPFVYQCKLRKGVPDYLRAWLDGIVAAGKRQGATGIVVWKAPHARDDDAVVVLRLKDWQDWHGV